MATPRVCVLRAPGTNCDEETAHAFELCGAVAERVHLFRLLENPAILQGYQILCVPGGFSYGDDLGAGVIFSRQLRGRLGDSLDHYLSGDRLALGICNGFQVLLKAGLFSAGPRHDQREAAAQADDGRAGSELPQALSRDATLTWNDNGRYTALWVRLQVDPESSVFLRGISEIELPIAHAEGRIVIRDESVLQCWKDNQQIALCYADAGTPGSSRDSFCGPLLDYPNNPNGSVGNIAGLSDPSGRVLGLMPHPERFIHATHHPQWTRLGLRGAGDGLKIFRNAVEYFGAG